MFDIQPVGYSVAEYQSNTYQQDVSTDVPRSGIEPIILTYIHQYSACENPQDFFQPEIRRDLVFQPGLLNDFGEKINSPIILDCLPVLTGPPPAYAGPLQFLTLGIVLQTLVCTEPVIF